MSLHYPSYVRARRLALRSNWPLVGLIQHVLTRSATPSLRPLDGSLLYRIFRTSNLAYWRGSPVNSGSWTPISPQIAERGPTYTVSCTLVSLAPPSPMSQTSNVSRERLRSLLVAS